MNNYIYIMVVVDPSTSEPLYLKVGKTTNLKNRLQTLHNNSIYNFELVKSWVSSSEKQIHNAEQYIHKNFKRVYNEDIIMNIYQGQNEIHDFDNLEKINDFLNRTFGVIWSENHDCITPKRKTIRTPCISTIQQRLSMYRYNECKVMLNH
ncbi:GIY-YIG nuclease family protein [Aeromonas hydrophila]|uniref:GIY-YIG nuclease family protein n=1 Tax=Aeromonas hydrophila TaxID=644 RepID=UPI00398921B6